MMRQNDKKLVFENGTVLYGNGFGANVQSVCEVVFNTAMVGYQEILSDCNYNEQMVCMTYPMIGNYGMAAEDYESRTLRIGGMIVREYNDSLANFRAAKTLGEVMEEQGVPGIEGVDTRRITRMLREEGSMRAMLCDASFSEEQAIQTIKGTPAPHSQVAAVSCKKKWYARAAGVKYNVVAIDCGIRNSIIQSLLRRGCNVTVVPYDTTAEQVLALAPNGLVVSNGPGNPQDVPQVSELIKSLQGKLPILGICLGYQLIALANGATCYKMKAGHRGANHPVKNLTGGKLEIVNQNHSYVVDEKSLEGTGLIVTHRNILDDTVAGLAKPQDMILGVQFQPESAEHSQDSAYLYNDFVQMMQHNKGGGLHA